MTDAVQIFDAGFRVLDTTGAPVSGAKIKFYDSGTSTPKTVYSNEALSTSLGSIVYTRSDGYPVASSGSSTTVLIYTGTAAYKIEITDENDDTIFPVKDAVKGAVDTSTFLTTSTVTVNVAVVARTTDLTVTTTHKGKLINCDASGGTFTLTLDTAVTLGDGYHVKLRNGGATNPVKIVTTSSQTIDRPEGATTAFALSPGEGVELACDGAGFNVHGYTPPLFNTAGVILIADRISSAPASPTSGARYIVTAAYSTFEQEDIIEADGQGGFFEITPVADCGWIAYVQDENVNYQMQGSAWVALVNASVVTAALGASKVLLQTATASTSATIELTTGLDDTYDAFEIVLTSVVVATDDVDFLLRVGTGAGPTYQASGYSYNLFGGRPGLGAGTVTASQTSANQIALTGGATGAGSGVGNAAGESLDATIMFANPEATVFPKFMFAVNYDCAASNGAATVNGSGRYNTAGAITGIRFLASAGNITSGRFSLYGLKKS